ncbi:PadR family transcriptional regulator [Nocardia sp. NPDC005366]|uniref:PadR family transcriptional regulator n=1 Tax=Nocardia sp. NPDC005366 TaxID=3156878 RepID=UPI0033A2BBEE
MPDKIRMTTSVASVLREFLEAPTEHQYGFDLMQRCGLSSGSLYPILARLEKAEWIVGRFEEIDPSKEGRRPRKYYTLTAAGARAAVCELDLLSERFKPPVWDFGSKPATGGAW